MVKPQKPWIRQGIENLLIEALIKSGNFDRSPGILPRFRSNFFHPSFNLTVENTVLFG